MQPPSSLTRSAPTDDHVSTTQDATDVRQRDRLNHWPVVDRLILARRVHTGVCRMAALVLALAALDGDHVATLQSSQLLTIAGLLVAACFAESGKLAPAAVAAYLAYALLVQPQVGSREPADELSLIFLAMLFLASSHVARTLWPDDLATVERPYNEVRLRLLAGQAVAAATAGMALTATTGRWLGAVGDIAQVTGQSAVLLILAAAASGALLGFGTLHASTRSITLAADPESEARSDLVDAGVCAVAGGFGAFIVSWPTTWTETVFLCGAAVGTTLYCVCRSTPAVSPSRRLVVPLTVIAALTATAEAGRVLFERGSPVAALAVVPLIPIFTCLSWWAARRLAGDDDRPSAHCAEDERSTAHGW